MEINNNKGQDKSPEDYQSEKGPKYTLLTIQELDKLNESYPLRINAIMGALNGLTIEKAKSVIQLALNNLEGCVPIKLERSPVTE